MLSRRPRVSSSSWLRYNESISGEIKDNVGVVGKRMESHKVGVIASPGLQASTETSTTSQCDNRMFGRSTRHVECNRNMFREQEQRHKQEGGAIECSSSKREAAGEEKSSDIKCNRVSNDISLAMSFTIQNSRRLTQRVRGSSRHRRRKSVEKLDRNVDVFQISCSKTNQRLAIDSNCSEITPCPQPSISHEEMQDFQKSARISDIDRLNNPSSSIYPKIPDKDKISRTRHEIFEARTRINYHRHDDTVMEHKTMRRRNSRESTPRGGGTLTRETERSKKMRTIWSQWACRKNRWIIILGLLMWTTLMITEVTGRQNHHRTCPGCPHQHVHTINRKSSSFDEDAEASSETETAPSPDDLRLEAIKHQILTKLGLRTRPDVNKTLASVPRHLALETLYRAEAQPPGHAIEPDGYHEGKRRDHRRGETEDEDSLSSPSSSSLSSSSSSSLSSSKSSSSLSQSSSSLSSKSSSSSKASLSSSSSSYGQFYYDGEEYSYRNVDLGVLEKDASPREYQDPRESSESGGAYVNNEKHRAHGDYRNGGKNRDYHVTHDDDEGQIEMDDFYARTSEIISFAEPGRTLNGQPLLEFPQSGSDPALEPLRIKRATLWARVEFRHAHHYQHHRRAQTNQRNITLWVFRVRCGNVTHLRGKELGEHLEMVTSLGVNVNQLGWQKFDVTKVVSNWYSGHELSATKTEKLTLLVDCTGCGSHVHVSTFGVQTPNVVESSINSKGGEDPDRPFLVVRTDPAAVKRVRRRAIECSGAIKGQCCKQRFYVSFSQLGWDDWIIAPQGYYANYCRGDCAAGHRTPDTFLNYYTHVIEEYRKMDRLAGMQPCCAPLKFSPMSLIYYGPDSNIIKRDLPKMVVDECGCP